ncbi:hypothetical protein [Streptomyces sp. NPDC055287]
MGIFLGLLSVIIAAGILWMSRLIARKAVGFLRRTLDGLRGTVGVVGTCVSSGSSRHLYRFTTADGESQHAYVTRTSDDDRRKTGSRARLRYRKDDPKTVSFAVVDLVAMPLGTSAFFFLAAFVAATALLVLFLGYVAVTEL